MRPWWCTTWFAAIVLSSMAACGAPAGTVDASASSLYNTGNHYARQGKTGMAVLYYERARILSPHDPDIRANLARVRAAAGLPVREGGWFEDHARFANPNVLYGLGVFGLGLAGVGALAIRFAPRRRRAGYAALGVSLPLLLLPLIDAAATWPLLHEAVVLNATGARGSPVTDSEPSFPVPEGRVVRIVDSYHDFDLIQIDAGREGWVARADLEPIT
jgi:hypothetical protein